MTDKDRHVRIRTAATDKRKALEHYQDLRRAGKVARAVVIAEDDQGQITILGQMLKPLEIGQLLLIAADALDQAENQTAVKRNETKFQPHIEPALRGIHNQSKPRPKEITTDAEGMLVPPPGENLISCGECNHPQWFVLHHNAYDRQSRIACAHCGNEVKSVIAHHPEGRA